MIAAKSAMLLLFRDLRRHHRLPENGSDKWVSLEPSPGRRQIGPGNLIEVESTGEHVTLRPVRPKALLKKERGVWVYQGEATDVSIPTLLDREREKRLRELAE
jgi:hypothetical protein